MKKFAALVCATSTLALMTGANAQNFSLTIQGTVGPICSVSVASGTTGATVSAQSSAGATVTINGFSDLPTGHINSTQGAVPLTIATNGHCSLTLQTGTANGGLANGSTVYPYKAGIATTTGTGMTTVPGGAGTQIGGSVLNQTNNSVVYVNFSNDSDTTKAWPAGTYSDTLAVMVTAGL